MRHSEWLDLVVSWILVFLIPVVGDHDVENTRSVGLTKPKEFDPRPVGATKMISSPGFSQGRRSFLGGTEAI